MANTQYLKKRRQGWYLNLPVPSDLQHKHGTHIVKSLKTRDLSVAQSRRWELVAEWHAQFEVDRGTA